VLLLWLKMPSINIATEEQLNALKAEVAELRALIRAYITTQEEWLTTEQALRVSGIKSRETLAKYARATAPDTQQPGRITYRKQGVGCRYARTSCIDYAQRKLGQPSFNA
jgi:hypothetical protein